MSLVIRTLIVDDEPLARDGMRVRLEREPDVEVVGEAVDGVEAVEAIASLLPDLVFLDVQMPGIDGFEVVSRVAGVHLPLIIFVTAYDQYALKAFEVHALDYLLKPVTHRRLQEALRRARHEVSRDEGAMPVSQQRLLELIEAREREQATTERPREDRSYVSRFTVKDRDRFLLIKANEIERAESAANYVRLHARGASFLIRTTMTELEKKLDPAHFSRIHRSTIVNLDRIKEIRPEWHGDFDVVLVDGTTLRLSRSYRDRLIR